MWQGCPLWAEIDLSAVTHNVRELKRHIGKTELLAVVKANAYGHGAVMVARTALENGASWLGVARVDEAVQLRRAGIGAPILILGYATPYEADAIVAHRVTPTVNTRQLALALSTASAIRNVTTPVHIKVDTGLTRFGLLPGEIVGFAKELATLPNLRLEGLYTHFATSDESDKTFVHEQLAVYQETLQLFAEAGLPIAVRHASNSGAALDVPAAHLDMVRCGITVYGLYPSDAVSRQVKLKPVLSLKARVARVREVPAGTSVSYGRTFRTEAPALLALIPVGYADGYSRALSNRGEVLVRGQRAPIVGRVCMDQFVVNVTDVPGVRTSDEVVIIGHQGEQQISADELATHLGTISYEITSSIAARVPRIYVRQGKIIAADSLITRPDGMDAPDL